MSPSSDQNDCENITITGLEIQPNIVSNEEKGSCVEGEWQPLSKESIIKMVNDLKLKLKLASPLSSEGGTANEVVVATPVSFRQPEGRNTDTTRIEKQQLAIHELGKQVNLQRVQKVCRFSLSERQEEWMFQQKKRNNGRYDTYYYHKKSNSMFRSRVEVVKYALYEIYPQRPRKAKSEKSKEESLPPGFEEPRYTSSKRKRTSCAFDIVGDSSKKSMPPTVGEILDAAYNNLQNLCTKTHQGFDSNSEPAADTSLPSHSYNEAMKKTVEEFLDAAHKNLLNFFNKKADQSLDNEGKTKVDRSSDNKGKAKMEDLALPTEHSKEASSETVDEFLDAAHDNCPKLLNEEAQVPHAGNEERVREESQGEEAESSAGPAAGRVYVQISHEVEYIFQRLWAIGAHL